MPYSTCQYLQVGLILPGNDEQIPLYACHFTLIDFTLLRLSTVHMNCMQTSGEIATIYIKTSRRRLLDLMLGFIDGIQSEYAMNT